MLNKIQINNAKNIIEVFKTNGVTNPFTIAAVLSVCMKETGIKPISENLNYTSSRIMKIWTRISLEKAKQLQFKPVELGNYVYGDQPTGYRNKTRSLGNGINEGYLFRGRGYNQLTGKTAYKKYGNIINENLVNNPDLVLNPVIAAKILFVYIQNNANAFKIDLNKLTLKNAYNTIYCFNAGISPKLTSAEIQAQDTTGGYLKGKSFFNYFLDFVNNNNETKKKINIGFILLILGVTTIITINNKKLFL